MALIWEFVNDSIENVQASTYVQFRVKDNQDAELTSTDEGNHLIEAVNNQSNVNNSIDFVGTVITCRDVCWSLGYAHPAGVFDWNAYFTDLDDSPSNYHQYLGDNILAVKESQLTLSLPAVGYKKGSEFASNNWGASNTHSYAIVHDAVWESDNYSAIITIKLPSSSAWGTWYIASETIGSTYSTFVDDTYEFGGGGYAASVQTGSINGFYNHTKDSIEGLEILFGATFSILESGGGHVADYNLLVDKIIPVNANNVTMADVAPNSRLAVLKPITFGMFEAPPPVWDFSLSINPSGLNIPIAVNENSTVDCSFQVSSTDYNGSFQITMLDLPINDSTFENELINDFNIGDDLIAQYGTLVYTADYTISPNETITIPFAYEAGEVGTNQTDSWAIFVTTTQLSYDSEHFGDFFTEAITQWADEVAQGYAGHSFYTDVPTIQIVDEDVVEEEVDEDFVPSDVTITKPSDIIYHLAKTELGYDKGLDDYSINESRANHDDGWDLGFCINKEIDSKKLIQEISQSSKSFPTFSNDRLKFITIKSTYDGTEDINTIKSAEVIKYNFSRTKIEDVKTQIEVKHKYDYGLKNHIETTGEIKINEHYVVNNAYWLTGTYGDLLGGNLILNNYYGIKRTDTAIDHIDTFLTVENDYIRESGLAERFARYLLYWHMNQHNIVELTLPLKYFALEIGDLIEFDDMILGKKVYGENYSRTGVDFDMPFRCGQYILPLFMVTETSKSIKDIKIKAIQLHNMTTGELNYKGEVYPSIDESDVNPQDFPTDIPEDEEIIVYPEGDLNQDGIVNVLDAILLIQIILYGDQEGGNSNDLIDSLDDMLDE